MPYEGVTPFGPLNSARLTSSLINQPRQMNKQIMLRFATRVLIVFGCSAAFTDWSFAFQ